MKKIILSLCVVLFSLSAMAQSKGDFYIGANVSYGFDMEMIGIGPKVQYNFTDAIRGEAGFNYFLEKDNVTAWDIQANVHYLFGLSDKFVVYPLAGIGYLKAKVDIPTFEYEGVKVSGSASDGDVFFNLGGGVQYALTDKLNLTGELKYQFKDEGQLCLAVGIAYKF